jgi:hypothetical protein
MAPCGWTVTDCGCGGCLDRLNPAQRARALALATHFMWAATGRRYGLCEVTVLPCNPPPGEPLYQTYPVGGDGTGMRPVIEEGQWHNRCGGGCTCTAVCEAGLPPPVDSVIEVQVDGVVVDPTVYEVHDGHLLVRVDGTCWPSCQRFGAEVPGFQITYLRGTPIPAAVLTAATVLACEYGKACVGADCRLPARLASLTRQGVEVTVSDSDSQATVSVGGRLRSGIPEVDDVIAADNPYGLPARPQVWSPDLPPARMVTAIGNGS